MSNTFKIIHTRLEDLMRSAHPESMHRYEPDDVFDTHGLYVDIADTVDGMPDAGFEEAAMDRLIMDEFFCEDCGSIFDGTIERCDHHVDRAVEVARSWDL